ncbi:MAG: energy transducer TonB [Pseudomonadota bacterium]
MKRLLLAAGLALTIHGILLGAEPGWIKKKVLHKPRPRVVTLTLSYYQPERPQVKPVLKRQKIYSNETAPVVKKKEREHIPKQKPQKPAKAFTQSKKENVPRVTDSAPPPLKPEPFPEPEQPEIVEELFEPWEDFTEDILEKKGVEEKTRIASIPPAQVLREARPMYRTNPSPHYPRLARKRGYEGTVVLEVLVDPNGRVKNLQVFKSGGYPILDKAAADSVKDWLFEPGMRGDEKVEMWVKIPIRFQLK